MDAIFIIGATLAFSLLFLVFSKKNKSDGDYVLAAWLTVLGLYYIVLCLYAENVINIKTGFTTPLLLGPFLYVYVLVLTNETGKFKSIYWLHGLPFLLFNLYMQLNLSFPIIAEKSEYLNFPLSSFYGFMVYYYITLGPVYVILSLLRLKKHTENIYENFSYSEQINLHWLKYVTYLYSIFWITIILTHLFSEFPVMAVSTLGFVIYLSLTIFIFFLGYFGLKQQTIYKSKPTTGQKCNSVSSTDVAKKEERYKKSGLKQTEAREYLEKLFNYFENEKPYLNGKLCLSDVAAHLDISHNYLSQIINEQLDKTFFRFANEYRVKEVKYRLSMPEYKQYTLLTIALESGFNTKSNFNRIFKKHTGLSPSQYITTTE